MTSNRLYDNGFREIQELRAKFSSLSKIFHGDLERFKFGLTFYNDLVEEKVTKYECNIIFDKLAKIIKENISDDLIIELVGGFRR